MSQRVSKRAPKKRKFEDFVQGPVFPVSPKNFQKGSTTSATTGPQKAQGNGKFCQQRPQKTSSKEEFSMDLFALPAPQKTTPMHDQSPESTCSYVDTPTSTRPTPATSETCIQTPKCATATSQNITLPAPIYTSAPEFQMTVIETLLEILDDVKRISRDGEPAGSQFLIQQIQNEEQFHEVEKELEKPLFRRSMISQLSRIGGKSVRNCTKKVLDRLLTNRFMTLFNMNGGGQQGKRGFKKTALHSVISEAVMTLFGRATEEQINAAMADHFKQAPGRTGGGGYRNRPH